MSQWRHELGLTSSQYHPGIILTWREYYQNGHSLGQNIYHPIVILVVQGLQRTNPLQLLVFEKNGVFENCLFTASTRMIADFAVSS